MLVITTLSLQHFSQPSYYQVTRRVRLSLGICQVGDRARYKKTKVQFNSVLLILHSQTVIALTGMDYQAQKPLV